jgi:hypothetical protein
MDCAWLSGRTAEYVFRSNLLVPYYSNSQAQTGLVDATTTATNYSGLGVYVQTGASVAARLSGVGFAADEKRLRWDSPYVSGGASRGVQVNGSVRMELGVDGGRMEEVRGAVRNVRVTGLSGTGATLRFTAPDTVGCPVDYSTSSTLATFNRVTNGGGSRWQSVTLSGLSGGTEYYARINCAREQPVLRFRTD